MFKVGLQLGYSYIGTGDEMINPLHANTLIQGSSWNFASKIKQV